MKDRACEFENLACVFLRIELVMLEMAYGMEFRPCELYERVCGLEDGSCRVEEKEPVVGGWNLWVL